MSRKGGQPSSHDIGAVFFTNLQLLGFDPAAMSALYSIPFNRHMFNLPNKKAYEVVVHFLFSRLNLTMCREQFRDCWPIGSKKAEQEFNRTVTRWLTDISKEEPDSNLPRIVLSLFHSPGGEKFKRLLFHFSTFVLKKCIKQEQGVKDHEIMKRPMLTPNNTRLSGAMRKAVMCSAIRHRKRFLRVAQESMIAHKEWKDFASELVKDYRKISKNIRELEHELRDARQKAEERAAAKGSSCVAGKALAVKRAQSVQQVRAMWKEVQKFSHDQSAEKEVMESIFQSVNSQYRIDGREINLNVPELLLRKCQNEIQRRGVENTYEGGKLNLLSLIQLWNLSLHLYTEQLREEGVPELDVAPVSTVVHTIHAQLANLEALREQVSSELLPSLKTSIDELRSSHPVLESEYSSPSNRQTMPVQLTLPSPLQMCLSLDPSKEATPPDIKTRVTPKSDADTPVSVNHLTDSVEKAARKSQSVHEQIHVSRSQPKMATTKAEEHQGETTAESRRVRSHLPTRQGSKPSVSRQRQPLGKTQSDKTLDRRRGHHASGERIRRPPADGIFSPDPPQLAETRTQELIGHSDPNNNSSSSSTAGKHRGRNLQQDEVFTSPSSHRTGYTPKHRLHGTPGSVKRTPAKNSVDILADHIAGAVMEGSPLSSEFKHSVDNTPTLHTPDFNVDNLVAATDEEVFASRDLIGRSPDGVAPSHTPQRPTPASAEARLRTPEPRRLVIEDDDSKENENSSENENSQVGKEREAERLSETEMETNADSSSGRSQVFRKAEPLVDVSDGHAKSVSSVLEPLRSHSSVIPRDFEDDSVYVPVEEGLQYTSPYRPNMSGQAESLHEKIARYKQLRSTILSSVTSQRSPVKREEDSEEQKKKSSPHFARNPADHPVRELFASDGEEDLDVKTAKHSPKTNEDHQIKDMPSPDRPYRLTSPHREELYSLQVDDLMDLNANKTYFHASNGSSGSIGHLSTFPKDDGAKSKSQGDFLKEESFSQNHLLTFDLDLDIEGQGLSRFSPLKTHSPANPSRTKEHVTFSPKETLKISPDSYNRLFSLDVEDLDLGVFGDSKDSEHAEAKSSSKHADTSHILDDSYSLLESSLLNFDGSFLVPTSPKLP